jgi:hypothetical protein
MVRYLYIRPSVAAMINFNCPLKSLLRSSDLIVTSGFAVRYGGVVCVDASYAGLGSLSHQVGFSVRAMTLKSRCLRSVRTRAVRNRGRWRLYSFVSWSVHLYHAESPVEAQMSDQQYLCHFRKKQLAKRSCGHQRSPHPSILGIQNILLSGMILFKPSNIFKHNFRCPTCEKTRLPCHLSRIFAIVVRCQYFAPPSSREIHAVRVGFGRNPISGDCPGVPSMGNIDILTILVNHDGHGAGSADCRRWAVLSIDLFC